MIEPVTELVRRLDMLFENQTSLITSAAQTRLGLVLHLSLFLLGFLTFPHGHFHLLGLENSFAACINYNLAFFFVEVALMSFGLIEGFSHSRHK